MPAAQIKSDNGDEAFNWVIDGGHGEESLGVSHETMRKWLALPLSVQYAWIIRERRVLRDSLQHGPRLQNKGWQNDPTEVGARSQLRDDMREY